MNQQTFNNLQTYLTIQYIQMSELIQKYYNEFDREVVVENTTNYFKSINTSEWKKLTLTFMNTYSQLILKFLDTYSIHILISGVILLLLITLLYQVFTNTNLNKLLIRMEETETMDLFKMRAKMVAIQNENFRLRALEYKIQELEKNTDKLENTIDMYRCLRLNKLGYFILNGQSSDRTFRKQMKEVNGEYLGKNRYLLKLTYLNKFDNGLVEI